jgi:hypothetical protein
MLRDVYAYIPGTSVEWGLATRAPLRVVKLEANIRSDADVETPVIRVRYAEGATKLTNRNTLKVFRTWRRVSDTVDLFEGQSRHRNSIPRADLIRNGLRPELLYMDNVGTPFTPISGRALLLPEELPILLAFFHLSSVVRYNPEFVSRLRDSKYWPVVASLRWHGLFQSTQLLLSFVRQESFYVLPPRHR